MQSDWAAELREAGFAQIETHISRVFLRGNDVYKTKRDVALGFLDFTDPPARKRACLAEVALNRRMAAGVYLGVEALVRDARGMLAFVPDDDLGDATLIEWAVHMRRLSDDDRADVRLARGQLGEADLRSIAHTLARFHLAASRDADTARFGSPEMVTQNVEENFAQMAGAIDAYVQAAEVDALARAQRTFLHSQREIFAQRARDGFARDGHGDLRLEHLYRQADGSYLAIDCIEFNDRFRYADVCADLAFLTMDLTVHGRADLAELLTAHYAEETGDFGLYALLDFYQSYRATVRAKVALLLARDPDVTEAARDRGAHALRRYFLVALAAQRPAVDAPRLIVTFGSIAGGKSTLAAALRARLSVPVVSTDRVRKQLLGVAPTTAQHDDAFSGAYSAEATARVYDSVFAAARQVLASGRSVVVDGSFRARAERARVAALAADCGVDLTFLECWCPDEERAARLARRARAPSVSDGRAEIYGAFAAQFEVPSELPAERHVRLDTTRPADETLAEAIAKVGLG